MPDLKRGLLVVSILALCPQLSLAQRTKVEKRVDARKLETRIAGERSSLDRFEPKSQRTRSIETRKRSRRRTAAADATSVRSLRRKAGDWGRTFKKTSRRAGGSQGGKWYRDENGQSYFGKKYGGDVDRLLSERLTNDLYRLFGHSAPDTRVVEVDSEPLLLSRELPGKMRGLAELGRSGKVTDGFVIDAWLANHDVTGAGGDNMLVDGDEIHRIDNGGALIWRARGQRKEFSAEVRELDSMRDARYPAGKVFSGVSDIEVIRQLKSFSSRYEAKRADIDRLLEEAVRDGMSADTAREISEGLHKRARWLSANAARQLVARRTSSKRSTKRDAGVDELARLNDTQRNVLRNSDELAKKNSKALRSSLLQRFEKLGYERGDLDSVLKFVREEALVTVNFNPTRRLPGGNQVIDAFLEDTHYRNQFETRVSGGTLAPKEGGTRDGWEKINFSEGYHQGEFDPFERPKYGQLSLNRQQKPSGSNSQYGDCYFILKDAVKARTTVTPSDSGYADANKVGTFSHFEVVLSKMDDSTLRTLADGALDRPVSTNFSRYIEAQIHGPVELERDVDALVANERYRSGPNLQKVRGVAKRFNVPLYWRNSRDGTLTKDDPAKD